MKKHFKRILTVVLALVFAVVSMTAAFAAGSTGSGSGGGPGGSASGGSGGGSAPGGSGGGGGADSMTYDYSGTMSGVLTADGTKTSSESGKTYTAATADQNAALAENGGTLTVKGSTFKKSGDDSNGDNCNFYGINSIVLCAGSKTKSYISESSLTADSEGSNGIFATDSGTVYAYKDSISTTADNSRGLDATYGGSIIADSMGITTKGDHCAALATDRGGGNVSVTNSTLSTAGSGSPLLYSTGDVEVDNVSGTASGSQIAGMEGLNTIRIYDSSLTSGITKATASDPVANGVIIYQSTSGDAESTTGEAALFEASNSTLKSSIASGSMFYITNTTANVVLSNTTLDFDNSKAALLKVEGNDSNSWGTAGSNGATVNFTGLGETLTGDVSVDTISTLNLYLLKSTTYTGSTSITKNSVNTSATDAPLTVNLDSTSKWVVTGNSTVTNLNAESGAKIVDESGKTVTIVANGKTVVDGDSDLTVTVTGSYSTKVSTSSVNELSTSSAIDRSGFDSYYGTSTTLGANAAAAAETTTTDSSDDSSKKSGWSAGKIAGVSLLVAAVLIGGSYATYRAVQKKMPKVDGTDAQTVQEPKKKRKSKADKSKDKKTK